MSLTAQYLRGPLGYPARLSSACPSDHVSLLMVTYLTFTKLGYLIQQYYYNSYAFIPSCIVHMINIKNNSVPEIIEKVRAVPYCDFVTILLRASMQYISMASDVTSTETPLTQNIM